MIKSLKVKVVQLQNLKKGTFYVEEQLVDSNQTNNLWDIYSLLGLVT